MEIFTYSTETKVYYNLANRGRKRSLEGKTLDFFLMPFCLDS